MRLYDEQTDEVKLELLDGEQAFLNDEGRKEINRVLARLKAKGWTRTTTSDQGARK